MATWTFAPAADEIRWRVSAKLGTDTVANSGHCTDADIGKPVKLSAAGKYAICSDGDQIDGFITSISDFTIDGWSFGTVQIGGRVYASLDGGSTFGYIVEAAAQASVRTAHSSGYGRVSSNAIYTTLDATATGDEAIPFILARKWRIISGAVTDAAKVLLERV